MEETYCKYCIHFRQHYIIDEQSCSPVDCGHCTTPRLKKRTPDATGCSHFVRRTCPESLPNRDRVIHFLTEEMLRYIMSLELPPDISESK